MALVGEPGEHQVRGGGDDRADQQRPPKADARQRDAAGESPRDADPHAVDLRHVGDVGLREAEIDIERVGHDARDEIRQAEARDEQRGSGPGSCPCAETDR